MVKKFLKEYWSHILFVLYLAFETTTISECSLNDWQVIVLPIPLILLFAFESSKAGNK